MKDCIFCKIVNNEIPSMTIYEDDIVKVFLDINPEVDGHTLIIPKKHYKDIDDIDNDTLVHIINVSRKIKELLYSKLNCDGITLFQNNGDCQDVKHFHMHLRPYYKNKKKVTKEVLEIFNVLNNDN